MKMDIYVGEETGPVAKRHLKMNATRTFARGHLHLCCACLRRYYCWCGNPEREDDICLGCLHEASLPKVRTSKDNFGVSRVSKLFSDIQVSQGGWTPRWVTTRELRAALKRWIRQEYKANPPEVTAEGVDYQCGGCRFFLALDSDYGICSNAASPYDGRIVFEHIGCKANPWYIKNHEALKAQDLAKALEEK